MDQSTVALGVRSKVCYSQQEEVYAKHCREGLVTVWWRGFTKVLGLEFN